MVCVCVCMHAPGLTLLQEHGHTNIHKNKGLRLRDTYNVASNRLCSKLTAAKTACLLPATSFACHVRHTLAIFFTFSFSFECRNFLFRLNLGNMSLIQVGKLSFVLC